MPFKMTFSLIARLPSLRTADEWLGGSSKGPVLMSLNPLNKGATGPKKAFKLRTVAQVSAELEKANKRVTYLEEKLKAAGIEC